MSETVPAVHAAGLAKHFGDRAAVGGVDVTVQPGDCLALFGPNGAGKTTLLRLVAGLLKPSAGSVLVKGVNVRQDAHARGAVGLVSHQSMLYAPLTVRENVLFSARLCGVVDPERAATTALESLKIADAADTPVRKLSRGQQQRVSIARAIVHSPAVLLLDEPYSGLDENGAVALTTVLATLRMAGATLLLVTHNVAEGLAIASHAAVMLAGKLTHHTPRPKSGFDAASFATQYRGWVGADGA